MEMAKSRRFLIFLSERDMVFAFTGESIEIAGASIGYLPSFRNRPKHYRSDEGDMISGKIDPKD